MRESPGSRMAGPAWAYKAEHVVDLDTGALVDVAVHAADTSDVSTVVEAVERARESIKEHHDDDGLPGPAATSNSALPPSPVIEIVADKESRTPFAPELQAGPTFDRIAYDNGLIARCMGDTLGFSPPLIVEEQDVDDIADRCEASLKMLESHLRP